MPIITHEENNLKAAQVAVQELIKMTSDTLLDSNSPGEIDQGSIEFTLLVTDFALAIEVLLEKDTKDISFTDRNGNTYTTKEQVRQFLTKSFGALNTFTEIMGSIGGASPEPYLKLKILLSWLYKDYPSSLIARSQPTDEKYTPTDEKDTSVSTPLSFPTAIKITGWDDPPFAMISFQCVSSADAEEFRSLLLNEIGTQHLKIVLDNKWKFSGSEAIFTDCALGISVDDNQLVFNTTRNAATYISVFLSLFTYYDDMAPTFIRNLISWANMRGEDQDHHQSFTVLESTGNVLMNRLRHKAPPVLLIDQVNVRRENLIVNEDFLKLITFYKSKSDSKIEDDSTNAPSFSSSSSPHGSHSSTSSLVSSASQAVFAKPMAPPDNKKTNNTSVIHSLNRHNPINTSNKESSKPSSWYSSLLNYVGKFRKTSTLPTSSVSEEKQSNKGKENSVTTEKPGLSDSSSSSSTSSLSSS